MPITKGLKRATIGLFRRDEINEFLDNLNIKGLIVSRIVFAGQVWGLHGSTEGQKSDSEVSVEDSVAFLFDDGECLAVNMLGAMYNTITLDMNQPISYFLSSSDRLGNGRYELLFPIAGKRIAEIGFDREDKSYKTLRMDFSDGSSLSMFHPTEDSFRVRYSTLGTC